MPRRISQLLIITIGVLAVAFFGLMDSTPSAFAQGTPPPRDTPTPGAPPRNTPTQQASATATLAGTPARVTPTESIPSRSTPTAPPSSTSQPPDNPAQPPSAVPQETPIPTPGLLPVTGNAGNRSTSQSHLLLALVLVALGTMLLASVGRSHKRQP